MAALARIRVGAITVQLPDGTRQTFGDAASPHQAEIHVHDHAAFERFLIGGETGGGEAYMDGLWSSPDLAALIRVAALNRADLALASGWWRIPAQLQKTLAHRARRNTKANARRNIAAHYDLSNDLYRLFLDESMTYSAAVYESRRPDARGGPAGQVPADGRAGRAAARDARPGDRHGLGRLRPVRRGPARLPGDDR